MAIYWRARPVEELIDKLIIEHHGRLYREDVRIVAVFSDAMAKSKGRTVLGRARKIGGLSAALVDLGDAVSDFPVDFFVVEIPFHVWDSLTNAKRTALVDHELSHFDVVDPDSGPPRRLVIVGHDLEEFTGVVARHGLWKSDVEDFVNAAQLKLDFDGRT